MLLLKIATFFLVALAVGAEKKIELQDIEEDNLRSELKSELEKDHDKSDAQQNSAPEVGQGFNSLDFMKTGLLRFFENPQTQTIHTQPQQQRYVHQYAVTEPPERYSPEANKAQYSTAPQQAMVGYLSNMPMQIYLVPQYYSTPSAHQTPHVLAEFDSNGPQKAGTANNYVQAPAYVPPTAPPPPTYLYRAQPTITPALATVQPVISYQPVQVPVLNYNSYVPGVQLVPSTAPKSYYGSPDYSETNTIDEDANETETPPTYRPETDAEFPRHYNSRTPIRGHHYKHHAIPDLPRPNPLLLKGPPAHLSHIPRALPMYRPYSKQVYQENNLASSSLAPRPYLPHGAFKRRPTSLLDSYIPSSVQVEYLKRGLAKDPSSLYDALSSGRLPHLAIPRHVERGFLPNQMYPTAAGGVTYGHYKRNPKIEKFPHK
ncbi:hypothetical protein PYW07_012187 [Mythimna separata]|uniref:Uncharacterized protein n=1 Tax=Mythimna separata TaxID=271217 RepID=A0AAD7YMB0_MYTSE|nr:hypothetical protein PYW07_012187 [Mythimna separata]